MSDKNYKLDIRSILFIAVRLLIYPAAFVVLSGDLLWVEGWIFNIWFIVFSSYTIFYLYKNDPALLQERLRRPGEANEKRWDKYFLYVYVALFLLWYIIMPLDAKRYVWTAEFPLYIKIIGGIFLIISSYFMFRAFADNPFASHLVRIQKDRGQTVVSTGVYSLVRHPMYLGGVMMFIGAPMLLSSKYGILAGIIMSFFVAGRIIGEEKMLSQELDGYNEYKEKVKYRLIPYIW